MRQAGNWDSVALLQILPPDTPLLYLQNTKKLYGIKNNCMREQLEQILDQKIQKKKPKNKKKQKTTATSD